MNLATTNLIGEPQVLQAVAPSGCDCFRVFPPLAEPAPGGPPGEEVLAFPLHGVPYTFLVNIPHSCSVRVSARRLGSMLAECSQSSASSFEEDIPALRLLRSCLRRCAKPARTMRKSGPGPHPGPRVAGADPDAQHCCRLLGGAKRRRRVFCSVCVGGRRIGRSLPGSTLPRLCNQALGHLALQQKDCQGGRREALQHMLEKRACDVVGEVCDYLIFRGEGEECVWQAEWA